MQVELRLHPSCLKSRHQPITHRNPIDANNERTRLENFRWRGASPRRLADFGVEQSVFHAFLNVSEYGLQAFACEARVVVKNLLFVPTLRKQADDVFQRQPRAFDDGLAEQHVFVRNDVVLPVHISKVKSSPPRRLFYYTAMCERYNRASSQFLLRDILSRMMNASNIDSVVKQPVNNPIISF